MKALILAAGYATRLYPLTKDKPKALLKIGKQKILDFVVDEILTIPEIDKIYIVTNSRFYTQFCDWKSERVSPIPIEIIDDNTDSDENKLGAIGDINFVLDKCAINDDLLIMASDNIFTFKLKEFYQYFKEINDDTILVKKIDNTEDLKRMANVIRNNDGLVTDMVEKPPVPTSDIAAFASYLYKSDTLPYFKKYLGEGNNPDAPGFFPSWLCKQKTLYSYMFEGECYDIGTPQSYEEVNEIFNK